MKAVVISGNVAFPHLRQPCTQGFSAGQFNTTIYFPKTDSETVTKVNMAMQRAIGEKWGDNPPAKVKRPLKDGDVNSANRNFAGCYYFEARSKERPIVVDRVKQPITDGEELPNGCKCNFVLTFKAYEVDGNVGVTCYLNGAQYVQDGPWRSTNSVADLFDILNDD